MAAMATADITPLVLPAFRTYDARRYHLAPDPPTEPVKPE